MSELLGSLGLFLLGMWLMTEGLKLAGGRALEHLLGRWTRNKTRGLLTGIGITALLQSSSAVTVATLGFVNAGLISFYQALWVVFGSNVGTTFTAWIVALFGFTVKINAFAFPLVGIGAFLRIFATRERGRALGMALAGFGLLFLGIDALKNNFQSVADGLDVAGIFANTGSPVIVAVLLGAVLTTLTQSSSAAIAIILTAVASGIVGMEEAAASVIGANIGTTSTALLAALGATPNAKRLAWAHVVFNLLTGAVALIFLPLFLAMVQEIAEDTGLGQAPVVLLSVFHTAFNILGLLLILPLEKHLSRWLLSLYAQTEANAPKHLDENVASVPDLATRAVALELENVFLRVRKDIGSGSSTQAAALHSTLNKVNEFIAKALRSELAQSHSQAFAAALKASHHLGYALRAMDDVHEQMALFQRRQRALPSALSDWLAQSDHWLNSHSTPGDPQARQDFEMLKQRYDELKAGLIAKASVGALDIDLTDAALTLASQRRRATEQVIQAHQALQQLQGLSANNGAEKSGDAPATST